MKLNPYCEGFVNMLVRKGGIANTWVSEEVMPLVKSRLVTRSMFPDNRGRYVVTLVP